MAAGDLEVAPGVRIPEGELSYVTSRSSGPGGQNVNKLETRVTLLFDLEASESLDPEQKALVRDRLATRINKAGVLRVTAQKERSQAANRKLATERFAEILADALTPEEERQETKVPRSSRRRRLRNKKHRAEVKKLRKTPRWDD